MYVCCKLEKLDDVEVNGVTCKAVAQPDTYQLHFRFSWTRSDMILQIWQIVMITKHIVRDKKGYQFSVVNFHWRHKTFHTVRVRRTSIFANLTDLDAWPAVSRTSNPFLSILKVIDVDLRPRACHALIFYQPAPAASEPQRQT